MKRPKKITRYEKKAKFGTIKVWLESKRKAKSRILNQELKDIDNEQRG